MRSSAAFRITAAAMEGYTADEIAVVHRWLLDMTDVVTRHARETPPPAG